MGALPMPNPEPGASPLDPPVQPLVQSPLVRSSEEASLCQYRDARGRGCRMLALTPPNPVSFAEDSELDISTEGLCAFHARRLRDRHRAGQTAGAELLASITDFADAASVNRFLGNLARMVALRRIPRRDAIALAYISQLILNSQAAGCRGELQSLQVEALRRQLDPPTRVIWDLPRRKQDPERNDNSKPDENCAGTNTGQ
jgi:hypothetical protein